MKLITHNILMCNKKGCTTNNFPLKIIATKVERYDEDSAMEFTVPLMQRLLEKIEYSALYSTVQGLNWQDVKPLPAPEEGGAWPQGLENDQEFLQNLYEICVRRHITEGGLQCPNCEREFPIQNGIANMLLNEDEV